MLLSAPTKLPSRYRVLEHHGHGRRCRMQFHDRSFSPSEVLRASRRPVLAYSVRFYPTCCLPCCQRVRDGFGLEIVRELLSGLGTALRVVESEGGLMSIALVAVSILTERPGLTAGEGCGGADGRGCMPGCQHRVLAWPLPVTITYLPVAALLSRNPHVLLNNRRSLPPPNS